MSTVDLASGRAAQKNRTRRALLDAAAALMAEGTEPAIEAVAERAGVSRATAYRYFASAEALALEATLDSSLDVTLSPDGWPDDVAERAVRVQRRLHGHAREHEAQLRLFLASALRLQVESGGGAEVRMGRRLPMLEAALAPAREALGSEAYDRLVCALVPLLGIDALVALRDICGLRYDEAGDVMGWAVRALVSAALSEADG